MASSTSRDDSVTTVVPVYNGLPFLRAAVESLLAQTVRGRILVIDDGSTDGSGEYLDRLSNDRVMVIHQANAGLATTLNHAYADLVDTEFVARLDQDDVASPNRLATQLDILLARPDAAAVFTSVAKIGANGQRLNVHPSADGRTVTYEPSAMLCPLPSTMMARTDALLAAGGHRPELYPSDDYDFALRLAEKKLVLLLHEPLVSYRVHRGNATWGAWTSGEFTMRYAWAMHLLREAGLPEIPLDAWRATSTGGLGEVRYRIGAIGRLCFRRAGMGVGEGHRLAAACWMGPAMLLAPRYAWQGLRRATGAVYQ